MKLFKLIKSTFLFAIFLLISLLLFNCNDRETDNETSRVQLVLVDAPGDYEEVNVEIIDIQYNSSEGEKGWKSFTPENGYPIQVDLTKLIAGNDLLLTDEIIPAGTFKQIRLILSDNNTVLLEGGTTPVHLDTPSAEQSGLKIMLDENLEGGDEKLTGDLMDIIIGLRQDARSRKDFGTSDKIRDELKKAGVMIKDRKDGVEWERE